VVVYISIVQGADIETKSPLACSIDILRTPSIFGVLVEFPVQLGHKLIENLEQSLETKNGLCGEVGIFSFYVTKMMTTGLQVVMGCNEANRVIRALELGGIRTIIPIERRERLDNPVRHPVAAALTQATVSLPIYLGLSEDVARQIARIAKNAS